MNNFALPFPLFCCTMIFASKMCKGIGLLKILLKNFGVNHGKNKPA